MENEEIESMDFRLASEGLGFHKKQETLVKPGIVDKEVSGTVHRPTPSLSSMDLKVFYDDRKEKESPPQKMRRTLKKAGIFRRFYAWTVDLICLSLSFAVLNLLLFWVADLDIKIVERSLASGELWGYMVLLFMIWYIVYFTFLDLPASPGKALFGIRLAKKDRSSVFLIESFLRSGVTLFSIPLFFLPVLMNWHGRLSETIPVLRED